MTEEEMFDSILDEMKALQHKKNKNYGGSFYDTYDDLGPISGLVPLRNKLNRATQLVKGGSNDFESLEDTFIDLACYAVMNAVAHRLAKAADDSMRQETIEKILDTLKSWDPDEHYDPRKSTITWDLDHKGLLKGPSDWPFGPQVTCDGSLNDLAVSNTLNISPEEYTRVVNNTTPTDALKNLMQSYDSDLGFDPVAVREYYIANLDKENKNEIK